VIRIPTEVQQMVLGSVIPNPLYYTQLVRPSGLEPPTPWFVALEGSRSICAIQLIVIGFIRKSLLYVKPLKYPLFGWYSSRFQGVSGGLV